MSPKTLLLVSIETSVFGTSKYSVLTLRGGIRALVSLGKIYPELASGIEFLSFRSKFNFGLMVFRTRAETPWNGATRDAASH